MTWVKKSLTMERIPDKIKVKLLKKDIRKKILLKISSQNIFLRHLRSLLIYKKLFSLKEFKLAKVVMFFVSFNGEVETMRMISEALKIGKKVVVPLVKDDFLIVSELLNPEKELQKKGPYGISEPIPSNFRPVDLSQIDLVVVPGVAFDKSKRRLGRGGGYYDHFLSTLSPDVPKVGICFKFQIIQNLPTESHDIPLTHLITS